MKNLRKSIETLLNSNIEVVKAITKSDEFSTDMKVAALDASIGLQKLKLLIDCENEGINYEDLRRY